MYVIHLRHVCCWSSRDVETVCWPRSLLCISDDRTWWSRRDLRAWTASSTRSDSRRKFPTSKSCHLTYHFSSTMVCFTVSGTTLLWTATPFWLCLLSKECDGLLTDCVWQMWRSRLRWRCCLRIVTDCWLIVCGRCEEADSDGDVV